MEKSKKEPYQMPKKTHWHLYSLQTMSSKKMAEVINKVLKQEYSLVK